MSSVLNTPLPDEDKSQLNVSRVVKCSMFDCVFPSAHLATCLMETVQCCANGAVFKYQGDCSVLCLQNSVYVPSRLFNVVLTEQCLSTKETVQCCAYRTVVKYQGDCSMLCLQNNV